MNHLEALRAGVAPAGRARAARRSRCIYIFLSGGLAQHDSFDLKPDAPDDIRGEFRPIATSTPGIAICEHLPVLAQRQPALGAGPLADAPDRTTTRPATTSCSRARSDLPPGFERPRSPGRPTGRRSPRSPGAVRRARGTTCRRRSSCPSGSSTTPGGVIPGQFGGVMGPQPRPLVHRGLALRPDAYGAYPGVRVRPPAKQPPRQARRPRFQAPSLTPRPRASSPDRLGDRLDAAASTSTASAAASSGRATAERFDRHRQAAVSLLTDPQVRQAFDVDRRRPEALDRYGRNPSAGRC